MQHLSTRNLPERERLAFVHDIVGRHAAGMRFAPRERDAFDADFSILTLPGGVVVGHAAYDAFAGSRTPELLNDGRDDYQLMIPDVDFDTEIDNGRTVTIRAGDLLVLDQSVPFQCRIAAVRLDVVSLSRARLAAAVPGLGSDPFRVVPREAPGHALFAGYASMLRREAPGDATMGHLAETHLHQLAAAIIVGPPGLESSVPIGVIGAARLALVKKDIRARLADPELSVEQVARRQGVSPRYVQRLFAAEDTSFSDHVRALRLERAYARLAGADTDTIAAIAFEVGFGDVSSFNRAFRRRYGAAPSEIRARAMRGA